MRPALFSPISRDLRRERAFSFLRVDNVPTLFFNLGLTALLPLVESAEILSIAF